MRRFRLFLVAFFCVFVLAFSGVSPGDFGVSEVKADESHYNISYNPYYGMFQADFYGTSKDVFDFCILDLYFNHGGGIISLNSDIYVTSHIDIVTGNFVILGNGHSFIYTGPSYIFVAVDNILKVSGDANVSFSDVTFNGQGFCYSSLGVPGSLLELISGYPTLNLNNCVVCNSKNFTAFDRSKPLGGGTGINAWYGSLNCNRTTFCNISGACIYESEGGNPYANGSCNVTLNDCISYNVSSLFASGESVGCSHSLTINGGDYSCGGSSEYVTYSLGIDLGNYMHDSIYACINNAYIYSDGGMAIVNKGDMSLNNCDIRGDCLFSVVSNENNMSFNGGRIHDSGIGVFNSGNLNITGGSICNNWGFGVLNDGSIVQSGGNIHSNCGDTIEGKVGGVYQNGSYTIKDKGKIGSDNSVFLARNHVIDVDCEYMDMDSKSILNNYSPIVITLDLEDRYIGRKLINVINSIDNVVDKYSNLFVLGFSDVNYNSDRSIFNGVKNSAAIRAGSSIYGMEDMSLYLSGRYYLYYDNSYDGYNRTKVNYSRACDEFFWRENADIDFSTIGYEVLCDNLVVSNSFILDSFMIDENVYPAINTHFTDGERWDNNRTCKGVFYVRLNLDFCGNGGKTLDDSISVTEYNIDDSFLFPEYIFYRDREESVRNSLLDGNRIDCVSEYSQQGWNTRNDATYRDDDTVYSGNTITDICKSLLDYLLSHLERQDALIRDGLVTIVYYAVWDEYPVIDNIDIAIPVEDLSTVNEEYIINKSRTISKDREDNDNVAVSIEDFNIDEILRLNVGDAITFNITSRDGVNNISYSPLTIRISSNKPIKRRTAIRYFDMDNISLIEEDGGLMENSKWFNLLK